MFVEEVRPHREVEPLLQAGANPDDPAEHEEVEEGPVVRDQEDARVFGQRLQTLEAAHLEPPADGNADEGDDQVALPQVRERRDGALVEEAHDPEGEPLEPGQHFVGRRFHGRHQNPGTSLAMISFMISEVPPPMVSSRASRKARATGVSTT